MPRSQLKQIFSCNRIIWPWPAFIRAMALLMQPLAFAPLLSIAAVGAAQAADQAAKATPADPPYDIERDCFWQLSHGRGERIDCDFPVRMTPEELKKVQDLTRGVLVDARCNMVVSIERAKITEAINTPDHVFLPPPQPVTCHIETTKVNFPLEFTFQPRVVFKDGKAVKATPGMSADARATRMLSWPVRQWVNSSDDIETAMIRIINLYLKELRK